MVVTFGLYDICMSGNIPTRSYEPVVEFTQELIDSFRVAFNIGTDLLPNFAATFVTTGIPHDGRMPGQEVILIQGEQSRESLKECRENFRTVGKFRQKAWFVVNYRSLPVVVLVVLALLRYYGGYYYHYDYYYHSSYY